MSTYGAELTEGTKVLTLTPDIQQIISAGRVSLPTALNGDGTYGTDISLGATYSESQLSVIVVPVTVNHASTYTRYIDGSTLYFTTHYATSSYSFYTRNESTGVMSSWSGGARTNGYRSTWNPIVCATPVCFWDKKGATSFSNVRLFGATAYMTQEFNDISNVALLGTASGPADWDGTSPTYINDDNEGTRGCIIANSGQTPRINTITFSTTYCLSKIQMLYRTYGEGGTKYYQIDVYSNGQWIPLYVSDSIPNGTNDYLNTFTCVCNSVTAIRVQAISTGGVLRLWIYELRAYGSLMPTNKLVYSIGSSGVSTVDYMVALRKYDS